MTGSQISSADLDVRARRALFRSRHRGMREMDLIMGGFAEAEISRLNASELATFEVLLDLPDQEVFSWLTGETHVPHEHDTALYRRLLAFVTQGGPIVV